MKNIKLFEDFNDMDKYSWKDYFDILLIKYSVGKGQYRLIGPDHPEFEDCVEDCIESESNKDDIEIYSVKRKNDNEIFTLGGILYSSTFDSTFGIEITKLWPSFDQIRADFGNGGVPLNHTFFKSSRFS